MGYWDGKCFFCYWYAALVAIIALSAKPLYKDLKKKNKNEKVITISTVDSNTDSTSSN